MGGVLVRCLILNVAIASGAYDDGPVCLLGTKRVLKAL